MARRRRSAAGDRSLHRAAQLYIFKRGSARKQAELLEDETYLLIAHQRDLIVAHARDVFAVHKILPAGRIIKIYEDIHQCRFARAGRTDHRYKLTALYIDRDRAQCMNLMFAQLVGFREFAD
jgi:hypothetical protein